MTLGYVWTRPENEVAVKLYQDAGFKPNRQLVLTWYSGHTPPPTRGRPRAGFAEHGRQGGRPPSNPRGVGRAQASPTGGTPPNRG